jgi:hypothetical protein
MERRNFIAKPFHLGFVGHVCDMGGDPQTLRQPVDFAKLSGFRHCPFGHIAHCDIAALGNELANKLSPHSGTAAGDNRDPAGKILHFLCLPRPSPSIWTERRVPSILNETDFSADRASSRRASRTGEKTVDGIKMSSLRSLAGRSSCGGCALSGKAASAPAGTLTPRRKDTARLRR